MKMYCQKCGYGMKCSTDKPNFCSRCGEPLGSSLANKNLVLDKQKQGEDEDQNLSFANMNKLEVEIESFQIPKYTLGDIIESQSQEGAPASTQNEFENLNIQPEQTNEEFLKEFQNEAGTSRPNR